MKETDAVEEKPLFSILIPTWNNLDFLKLCVESIQKNSRYRHQIVLHINEGTDGSKQWVEQENICHTYSSQNLGVCGAMNQAYTQAKADYIVYMNDDMYACPDWDHYLWESIRQLDTNKFFISATAIEPKDVGKRCAITPFAFGGNVKVFNEKKLLSEYAEFEFEDWNGASWPPNVVHRSMWDAVNGYSEEFFPGFYSDPDFALKLWTAGVRHFYGVGQSRVYHFLEVSTNKLKAKMVREANIQFLKKWGISARMFNQFFLRMGTKYQGALPEPEVNGAYLWKRFCCHIKKALS